MTVFCLICLLCSSLHYMTLSAQNNVYIPTLVMKTHRFSATPVDRRLTLLCGVVRAVGDSERADEVLGIHLAVGYSISCMSRLVLRSCL